LNRAKREGVQHIVVTGTNIQESQHAIALATKHGAYLSATVGIHPHDADHVKPDWLDTLEGLTSSPHVVAVGEMGLDFYRNYSERDAQRQVFEAQLDLAARIALPVFVHDRDTEGEVLAVLRRYAPTKCVVHCFTGNSDELDGFMAEDFYIGVTGWICDERRGEELRRLVDRIPIARLLVETDAPYLLSRTMSKVLGTRRNEPAYLKFIIAELARLRRCPESVIRDASVENACRFFDIELPV
ncbi:MAG TPA: TatD family deoxyribonuclease, partial [Gammaproteobacteria bacterium]|nr:TatD family deoxyribonuclease [Gammaproteobacteria bacterium]